MNDFKELLIKDNFLPDSNKTVEISDWEKENRVNGIMKADFLAKQHLCNCHPLQFLFFISGCHGEK